MADVKQVAGDLYDAVSSHDLDALMALVAEDIVEHEEGAPGMPGGKQGVRAGFAMWFEGFPDLTIDVDDLIAEGDRVVARAHFRGTHRGEFMGVPATGRKIDVEVIDILRVQDGLLVEHWGAMDSMVMLSQLGVAPEPPA